LNNGYFDEDSGTINWAPSSNLKPVLFDKNSVWPLVKIACDDAVQRYMICLRQSYCQIPSNICLSLERELEGLKGLKLSQQNDLLHSFYRSVLAE
jgi:hypothetical protein